MPADLESTWVWYGAGWISTFASIISCSSYYVTIWLCKTSLGLHIPMKSYVVKQFRLQWIVTFLSIQQSLVDWIVSRAIFRNQIFSTFQFLERQCRKVGLLVEQEIFMHDIRSICHMWVIFASNLSTLNSWWIKANLFQFEIMKKGLCDRLVISCPRERVFPLLCFSILEGMKDSGEV